VALAGVVWVTNAYVNCARPKGGRDGGGEGGREVGIGAGGRAGRWVVKAKGVLLI
jgi:hypothetical protein